MTDDDQAQLAELASQRRDIVIERDRLTQEITDLTARLFLVNHRSQAIEEGIPQPVLPTTQAEHPSDHDRSRGLHDGLPVQAVSGAVAGPGDREAMDMST